MWFQPREVSLAVEEEEEGAKAFMRLSGMRGLG
jgi:hypothetical protein